MRRLSISYPIFILISNAMCNIHASSFLVSNSLRFRSTFQYCVLTLIPDFLLHILCRAFTIVVALAGLFIGAIVGACASNQNNNNNNNNTGVLRRAGLGAVAGTVFAVEVLIASRTYWRSEHASSGSFPSMAHFLQDLLTGTFIQDFMVPTSDQLSMFDTRIEDYLLENLSSDCAMMNGVTQESLDRLSRYKVTLSGAGDRSKDADDACCSICLEGMQEGDMARALPYCKHSFHLSCVDQWLLKHATCPICRHSCI